MTLEQLARRYAWWGKVLDPDDLMQEVSLRGLQASRTASINVEYPMIDAVRKWRGRLGSRKAATQWESLEGHDYAIPPDGERLLRAREVRAAVQSLRPRHRQVIIGFYWQGLDSPTIGKQMHITDRRVLQLRQRALQHLRAALAVTILLSVAGCALFRPQPTQRAVHIVTIAWDNDPTWPADVQFIVQAIDPTIPFIDDTCQTPAECNSATGNNPAQHYTRNGVCSGAMCSVPVTVPTDKQHEIMVRAYTIAGSSIGEASSPGTKIGYPNPLPEQPPTGGVPSVPRNLRVTKVG